MKSYIVSYTVIKRGHSARLSVFVVAPNEAAAINAGRDKAQRWEGPDARITMGCAALVRGRVAAHA